MKPARLLPLVALSSFLAACASQSVDMNEPRRLVATDSDVRLDAEIRGDTLGAVTKIPITYEITNNRNTPIAVAELLPETSYDPDTQTVIIALGAEVPGQAMLPRLAVIAPGQKKNFSATASVHLPALNGPVSPFVSYPHAVRVRLDFLGDTKPFERLVGIPERVVNDSDLAAALFPKWVEENETVVTNSLPMHWQGEPRADPPLPIGSARKKPGT